MPAPRGIEKCTAEELGEWRINGWDQSPYQYRRKNKVMSVRQPHMEPRRLIVDEEERAHQLPSGYTAPLSQLDLPHLEMQKRRQSLLGNAWHVGPAMFWVQVLVMPLLGRSCSSSCSSTPAAAAQTLLASAPLDHNLICCRSNTLMWGWEAGLYAFSMPFESVGYRLTRS